MKQSGLRGVLCWGRLRGTADQCAFETEIVPIVSAQDQVFLATGMSSSPEIFQRGIATRTTAKWVLRGREFHSRRANPLPSFEIVPIEGVEIAVDQFHKKKLAGDITGTFPAVVCRWFFGCVFLDNCRSVRPSPRS